MRRKGFQNDNEKKEILTIEAKPQIIQILKLSDKDFKIPGICEIK